MIWTLLALFIFPVMGGWIYDRMAPKRLARMQEAFDEAQRRLKGREA